MKDIDLRALAELTERVNGVESFQWLLIESLDDAAWIQNSKGVVVLVSYGFEKIFQRNRSVLKDENQKYGIRGWSWEKYIHEEDREKIGSQCMRLIGTEKHVVHFYRIVRPSGEIRYCMDRANPLIDEKGVVMGRGGLLTDLTDVYRILRNTADESRGWSDWRIEDAGRLERRPTKVDGENVSTTRPEHGKDS